LPGPAGAPRQRRLPAAPVLAPAAGWPCGSDAVASRSGSRTSTGSKRGRRNVETGSKRGRVETVETGRETGSRNGVVAKRETAKRGRTAKRKRKRKRGRDSLRRRRNGVVGETRNGNGVERKRGRRKRGRDSLRRRETGSSRTGSSSRNVETVVETGSGLFTTGNGQTGSATGAPGNGVGTLYCEDDAGPAKRAAIRGRRRYGVGGGDTRNAIRGRDSLLRRTMPIVSRDASATASRSSGDGLPSAQPRQCASNDLRR
jgi:hypothetical protein